MEPTSGDVGSNLQPGEMKNVVFKFNLAQMPVAEVGVWFNQPSAPEPRRPVALGTHHVFPAEVIYAAACQEQGCDCMARLGNN